MYQDSAPLVTEFVSTTQALRFIDTYMDLPGQRLSAIWQSVPENKLANPSQGTHSHRTIATLRQDDQNQIGLGTW